jgi:Pyridoxamine 5'-phosphate oxidase
MQTVNLAALYGAEPMDWAFIVQRLDGGITQAPGTGGPARHTCWLITLNPDGSPHVTGVGGLWAEGAFWFETGDGTRKGRNLARDPRCALSVAVHQFDLVVEGDAVKVDDPIVVAKMARAVGNRRVAGPGRRDGPGADRGVQRPVRRPSALARLHTHPADSYRGGDRRAWARHPLALLDAATCGAAPADRPT